MYTRLGTVVLKSGESVEAGVVAAPDAAWRERVQKLLYHKGDLWNWQNTELLTEDVGVEAYFYLLHRDGVPFCNIMTVELKGVGILGHVWTDPADRRQGAASQLMGLQMEHFRARGGQALYLGTGFDTPPYHIYRSHGFEGIEGQSGTMTYFATSQEQFESAYCAAGDTAIQPLDWPHWPAAPALFTMDLPDVIRSVPFGLFGRALTEGPLLPTIREHRRQCGEKKEIRALALQKPDNGAVVGLAVWERDPVWPDVCQVDVYCHPNFWDAAPSLLSALVLPEAHRIVAYNDAHCKAKHEVLQVAGFQVVATFPDWIAADTARTRYVDVSLLRMA